MSFSDQYPIGQTIQIDENGNQIAVAVDGNLYMLSSQDNRAIGLLEEILTELRLLRTQLEIITDEELTQGDLE